MFYRTLAVTTSFVVCTVSAAAIFAQSPADQSVLTRSRYLPQYTPAGELKLPENSVWRGWVFVGAPLTPNAVNGGQANFPEYHYVYIEPGSYEIYRKAGIFPDGTIFFKELQLTKGPSENPDGSRSEPSGRDYFPDEFNGADVTVKDSKRFAATGGWGTSISIISNLRLRPPRSKINRNARFAVSPAPRETKFGRSSTAYWTGPLFPKVAEADALSSA